MSNPIKPTIKTEFFPWLFMIISIAVSFYFYAHFPESVPSHWNMAGEVDNWSGKGFAAFFLPLLLIGMYILFIFLPYLDPKKENYAKFSFSYHVIKGGIMFVLTALYFIASLNALGYAIPVDKSVTLLIALLFIIIGSVMGRLKSNWFVGLRTPWSLSSETNWEKSNIMGGKIFIIAGLLIALEGFLPLSFRLPLFLIIIALLLFGTIGYSYYLYIKEKK